MYHKLQNTCSETKESREVLVPKVVSKKRASTTPSSEATDSAAHHRLARAARSVGVVEDYLEVIADLIDEGREARVVDIARRLGVTHVTVNRTVGRLQRDGLVLAERYRSIFLTEDGLRVAQEVRHRHQVVLKFLRTLGVPDLIARTDAEGIEHYVSEETLRAMERFLKRAKAKKVSQ
jgi:DtxR family manganese transport transcriptional regulator